MTLKQSTVRPGALVGVAVALAATLLTSAAQAQAPAAAAAASAAAEGPPPEMDRPTARALWKAEWYNEGAAGTVRPHGKQGGPWNAAFRRQMLDAAAAERAKWGRMIPGVTQQGTALGSATVQAAAATGTNWASIGPTKADVAKNGGTSLAITDSGRVSAVVFDPVSLNTIYAGFAGGGVWKTTNGGTTWATLTDSLGSLSVGALALDPGNSNTLYLGLGDAFDGTGVGLLKSTDGGSTWSAPVFLGDSTVINAIVVSPINTSIVMAATNTGLFRSTDAGATWARATLPTGQAGNPYAWSIGWTGGNGFVASIEANPTATTGTTDGQIHVTGDAGATWAKASGFAAASGVGRATIGVAPSARATLYAMAAVPNATSASDLADIFKSTNGGVTWTALGAAKKRYTKTNRESTTLATLLGGQGWYNQMVLVDPANASTAYFGGQLLLAKTTDGGSSFGQMTNWLAQYTLPYVHADFHAGAIQGSTLIVGTDGGLFKSTDAAKTFTDQLNIGLTTHLLYSVGSSPNKVDAVIGGFQDNGTRVRSGATSTFNQYIGGDGFGSAVHRTTGTTMLGSLYYTRIYKSTDGGLTFASANSGITESNSSTAAPFNTGIVTWENGSTADTLFTWVNAKVYKSTNYAGSWAALGVSGLPTTSFYIRGVGVAASNINKVGLVASGGRVFLSTNGGTSWTAGGTLPNNDLSLSKIAYDPVNPDTIYVASVAANASKSHLWKSTDAGLNFAAIDGTLNANGFPTGVPVNMIKCDPGNPSVLYAGTHLGVYRSLDAGTTWARFGAGLPLVNVEDIYVSADSTLVRAATFGRGFWQLTP
jgi:hypothetical protein